MKKSVLIFMVLSYVFAVDYETDIQPIFNSNCGNCHLGNSSGGLNLSNYNNLMDGDVIEPGNHSDSELYDRITRDNSDNGDMPPGNSELTQTEIDLIAQWIDEGALPEESSDISGCTDSNAITCEDEIDPLYFPECNTCSDDDPCENYYNPNATVDNGLCMYNDVPSSEEFLIQYVPDMPSNPSGFDMSWDAFVPPVDVTQYVLMSCADVDGDTDGDGELEYELCVMVIPPNTFYTDMSYFDDYSDVDFGTDDLAGVKYTLSVHYPNNNYWGSAFSYYYYEFNQNIMGDLNFDGIINVIDIVTMVNGILANSFEADVFEVADLNGDGIINVIDIVSLVNLIIA